MKRCEHVVQFYGQDKPRLVRNVAAYLLESLRRRGAALIIAAPDQRYAILEELRRRAPTGFDSQICLLDDAETLAEFMCDGRPDAALFDATVGARARDLIGRFGSLRAYGEMVGRLWVERAYSAAVELEGVWNELLDRIDFDLYCGYPIDVLSDEFQMAAVRPLLEEHASIVPSLPPGFDRAMRRAIVEVLGDPPRGLQVAAEDSILRLRSSMPRYADEILAKAKEYAV